MGEVHLRIGEIGFHLSSEKDPWRDEPAEALFYRPFRQEGQPDVSLSIHDEPRPPLQRPDELLFDALSNYWRLWRLGDHYLFEVFDTHPPHTRVLLALMDPDCKRGKVYVTPLERDGSEKRSLVRLMRPLGELLLVYHLSCQGGIMVHAAGVNDRGYGLAFVGPSEAGKTTLAHLWKDEAGVTVLSDERIVIRKLQGRFFVFGTPWPGGAMLVSPQRAPLERLLFISHAKQNRLSTQWSSSPLHDLFPQLTLPIWNQGAMAGVLECCGELIRTAPCFQLGFVNDERVIGFLRESYGQRAQEPAFG